MSRTPEPWKVDGLNYPTDIYGSPDETHIGPTLIATTKVEDFGYATAKVNAARIVACVNGCAGLNPAAYRQCVEALQQVQDRMFGAQHIDSLREIIQQALAAATGGQP